MTEAELVTSPRTGRVVSFDPDVGLQVQFSGSPGVVPARSTVRLSADEARALARDQQEVLLSFEDGDPRRPIVVGLMQQVGDPPLLELLLDASGEQMIAEVDDRRVLIEGEDEVVLRCGRASITLRSNGRVLIRGDRVDSHSRGVNRIKGGTVQIN
jgi:hypothetical protein